MTNMDMSIYISFGPVLYAEYEFYHILTSKGHFEPRLDPVTTRFKAVKSDDEHGHVDLHIIWPGFVC